MSDQYVTGNFPTMERLALCPRLKRNGFMKAVRAVFDDDGMPVPFTILPNGWFVD
jgi:hypothetical protein